LTSLGDSENTNEVVRVSSEKDQTISRPGQGCAGRHTSVLGFVGAKSVDDNLGFQIPDLDGVVSGGAQPVTVGREDESVDDFSSIKAVQPLALVQVPKHGSVVLTTRSGKRTIGGDADSVEVSSVSDEVVAKLAVGQVPNLDKSVPSSRNNKRNRLRRRKADAGDPLGVALPLVSGDLEFALSKGVPKTDGSITRSRNNLTVVSREGNRKNILLVSNEPTGGLSGGDVPKTQFGVPGSGEGELTVGGDNDITHEVRVSAKSTASIAIIVGGVGMGKLPDDDALVTGRRQKKVGVFRSGGKGGDPVTVSFQSSAGSYFHFSHG